MIKTRPRIYINHRKRHSFDCSITSYIFKHILHVLCILDALCIVKLNYFKCSLYFKSESETCCYSLKPIIDWSRTYSNKMNDARHQFIIDLVCKVKHIGLSALTFMQIQEYVLEQNVTLTSLSFHFTSLNVLFLSGCLKSQELEIFNSIFHLSFCPCRRILTLS